jgi:hypothetical protein
MEQRRWLGRPIKAGAEVCLLGFQGNQGILDDGGWHTVFQRLNELPDLCLDTAQLSLSSRHAGTGRHPEAIHLASEFLAELFEQVPSKQLLLQRVQNSSLDFVSSNRQMIRASPPVARPKTREPMSRLEDETNSADAAFREP